VGDHPVINSTGGEEMSESNEQKIKKAAAEVTDELNQTYIEALKTASAELGRPIHSDEELAVRLKMARQLRELEDKVAPAVKKASMDTSVAASSALDELMSAL
jgi:hypothetical protein